MGVRLYPKTKDPVILANLIGITPEQVLAAQNLDKFEEIVKPALMKGLEAIGLGAETQAAQEYDAGYQMYVLVKELLPEVENAKDFLLYGWGRVNPHFCEGACGFVDDESQMISILRGHQIKLPDSVSINQLEGLMWS